VTGSDRVDCWTAKVVGSYFVFCETDADEDLMDACAVEEGEKEKQSNIDEAGQRCYSA